jgi:hypothetical protein
MRKILFISIYCVSGIYGCEKMTKAVQPYLPKQPLPDFKETIDYTELRTRKEYISEDRAASRICCLNSSSGSIAQGCYWMGKAVVLTGVTVSLHYTGVVNHDIDQALAAASYSTLAAMFGYGVKQLVYGCLNKPAKEAALISRKHWKKFAIMRLKTLKEGDGGPLDISAEIDHSSSPPRDYSEEILDPEMGILGASDQ